MHEDDDSTDPSQGPDSLGPVLAAAARGDAAAWKEILARYGRRVYALAKSRCRDAHVAEEITQSVFVTVAGKIGAGDYQERGRFESWLFRVAMNRVRDHIRALKRRPEIVDVESTPTPAAGREHEVDHAALERLRGAMERLPDVDREVIELRHHAQMSFKQIAELLDEPMGTLLARHHRALKKLKEILGDAMDDGEGRLATGRMGEGGS